MNPDKPSAWDNPYAILEARGPTNLDRLSSPIDATPYGLAAGGLLAGLLLWAMLYRRFRN